MIDRTLRRELAALLRDHVELAAQYEKDAKFLLVLADDREARAHCARSATQERWMNRPQERSSGARRRRANAAVMGAIASVWSAVKLVSGVHIIADLLLSVGILDRIYDERHITLGMTIVIYNPTGKERAP